jgi:hypothetical protein
MRRIGFSTGALAHADFLQGVNILMEKKVSVIELSALRQRELAPLVDALETLDLSSFDYVSVHAPSQLEEGTEREIVRLLSCVSQRGWPIIVHPDVIMDSSLWSNFGQLLFLENMDKRKMVGRTASELARYFEKFPEASLCLDLGHVRQIDPTMSEAVRILERFGDRLGQLHVSEVNAKSTHDPLTAAALMAFRRISDLIPEGIPIILETPVGKDQVGVEIELTRMALHSRYEDSLGVTNLVPRRTLA